MAVKNLQDESEQIRMEIARNPETDERTLRTLAQDENRIVSTLVAFNSNTPEDVVNDIKNRDRVLKDYLVDVYDCYGNWSWRAQDYVDNIDPYFTDHAVVFSSDYETTDAQWWQDTYSLYWDVWEGLQSAGDMQDFVNKYSDDYPEFTLETIYEAWVDEGSPEDINEDVVAAAVLELYDDIEQDELYSNDGERAYILYDVNKITDLDEVKDWLFGQVYELRLFSIDLDSERLVDRLITFDFSDYELYDFYFDCGSECDDVLITWSEFEKLKNSVGLNTAVANKLDIFEEDIEDVVGDI